MEILMTYIVMFAHVAPPPALSCFTVLTAWLLPPPQIFMEFAKEQEKEDDDIGSLSTTFQWHRLRPDGPAPPAHGDSIVHQL